MDLRQRSLSTERWVSVFLLSGGMVIVRGGKAAAAMRGSQVEESRVDAIEGWKGTSDTESAWEELKDVTVGNRDSASATVLSPPRKTG
jgi:hypothetical protein